VNRVLGLDEMEKGLCGPEGEEEIEEELEVVEEGERDPITLEPLGAHR